MQRGAIIASVLALAGCATPAPPKCVWCDVQASLDQLAAQSAEVLGILASEREEKHLRRMIERKNERNER